LHGDDRIIWVNPKDSRHVVKGDDGGFGISYDRGVHWLYQRNLPVGQFYHIGLDNSIPFRVCGGLQDNNNWCGPSATSWSDGIVNEDWFQVGGGDGFTTVFDTTDNRTLYSSSQYLGITRVDLKTMERRAIRPMWAEGDVYKRGNWGPPAPLVGRFQEGANWNAPFAVSSHNTATIYGGMRNLYRSRDRGETWTNLGDFTTKVNRRTLAIMGQLPDSNTLSLDDGASFYPTVSAFSESPKDKRVLYVGTDDGRVHVSRDEGATWKDITSNVSGLTAGTWVRGIEASRHSPGTVFAFFDGHQNGDFHNYLFRSTDFGQTWTSIVADLPHRAFLSCCAKISSIQTCSTLAPSSGCSSQWIERRTGCHSAQTCRRCQSTTSRFTRAITRWCSGRMVAESGSWMTFVRSGISRARPLPRRR
jgi:hypothetical protein